MCNDIIRVTHVCKLQFNHQQYLSQLSVHRCVSQISLKTKQTHTGHVRQQQLSQNACLLYHRETGETKETGEKCRRGEIGETRETGEMGETRDRRTVQEKTDGDKKRDSREWRDKKDWGNK